MADSRDIVSRIATELVRFARPLIVAGQDADVRRDLFDALGWDLANVTGFPTSQLTADIQTLTQATLDLVSSSATQPKSFEDITRRLENIKQIFDSVRDLSHLAQNANVPPDAAAALAQLGEDLLHLLLVTYLARHHPAMLNMARILTLIQIAGDDPPQAATIASGGKTLRRNIAVPRVRFDRLGLLLSDPVQALRDEYLGANPLDTEQHTRNTAARVFDRFAALLADLGAVITNGSASAGAANRDPARSLEFRFAFPAEGAFVWVGAIVSLVAENEGGAGITIAPTGWVDASWDTGAWIVGLGLSGAVPGFTLRRSGPVLPAGTEAFQIKLSVERRRYEGTSVVVIGSPQATRIELGSVKISGELSLAANRQDFDLELSLSKGAVIIQAGDGDGFLQKILPKDGIHLDFDLTVGWSNKRGLYFGGGAGLEVTLPVNIDLFGVIKIDSVYLALEAKEDSKKKESAIRAAVATTVQVKLGPVSATVERFGLQATLSFPEKGGNLGVANLDLGFKPPNGVGLVIKAQVVTGGGYLYFDTEKEQYAGVLQLEIAQKFSLTAVGLLTTKMPDGKKGFSLLVIISVRFDPGIQLGYGFSLTGLGGLLGVNRTVKAEVLREGLRNGALGSILFPQNVVENAPQIISNLSAIFPPAQDRFLFGPMAIIGWGGSPPLLSMEIGIILELPEPFRLIILGRLRVTLPGKSDESGQAGAGDAGGDGRNQDTPKIKLQLDSLGIIDFGSGEISLDAYLYDSTIGPFTITGGMALRASFGAKPMFLLSVGGYHPAFQVPAGFPSVERVAIGLNKKESGVEVRLQLSAYFALTSNTVQFGAHLDLYVHIAGFVEIIGLLGFDALIQFKPFGVIASFEAMVSVKGLGVTLMAVGLQINLTGPSPWHVWGKAHFEILGFKKTAEFATVIGRPEPPPLPQTTNVENELLKELEKPSNWSSQLPLGESPLVTFRDSIPPKDPAATSPKKRVLVHPLAELHINQRLVPLKADPITKYGTTTPTGATTFTLTANVAAGAKAGSLVTKDLSDWFALAQFYVMSDDQKLSAPSFEEKNSGVRVQAEEGYTCGKPVTRDIEAAKLSKDDNTPTLQSKLEAATYLDQVAHLGAAGQSPMRAAGPAKYGNPSWWDDGITLAKAEYRVVGEEEDSTAPKARATRRAGAPSPSSLFEEAMDDMAAIAEPVMSYSAALTRTTQARQRASRRRTWVVPAIGGKRGGR